MGVSSLGYLAGKAARKPGPKVREVTPWPPQSPPPPEGIRIFGEHLSPKARVRLHGVLVPCDAVAPQAGTPDTVEFVSELILRPAAVPPAVAGVAPVQVINPDGQSADYDARAVGAPQP